MSTIVPRSTCGRNASCCARLKRWISSTKRTVFAPRFWWVSASATTWRISFRSDRAALHVRQERVLLRAVEAVDLVHEEDRLRAALLVGVGLRHDLADLFHARQHGGERDEARAGRVRHQRGERRLAGARRAPEDHRVQLAALEGGAEDATLAEQIVLPDDFVERARPH